jgi:hypothetical protein
LHLYGWACCVYVNGGVWMLTCVWCVCVRARHCSFPQMSSCFLLTMRDDSIVGIYDTLKQVGPPDAHTRRAMHKPPRPLPCIRGTHVCTPTQNMSRSNLPCFTSQSASQPFTRCCSRSKASTAAVCCLTLYPSSRVYPVRGDFQGGGWHRAGRAQHPRTGVLHQGR